MDLPDNGDDKEWIRETLEGNQEAYGRLIQKHTPLLYHMACRVLKNPQEAEDIVQDTFIEAFRHLSEFKHRSRFSTWLYTIALNRIRNMMRHSKVLRIYSLDLRRSTRDGHRPTEIMEKSPGPEEIIQKQFEHEALQRAVLAMPPANRDIFTLYYFDHCSISEIAKKVSRPPATVKVYLHRARKWISRELQKSSVSSATVG